ncbi:MAG: hypothetical protein RMI56_01930 [Sulfolobales archaeon]|nr:hypothetical protein [Sulfolobales archaeon]MDW8082536.1 hypothetical protein [Sulfolobales archaeon]
MSANETSVSNVRVRCFNSVWVDIEGVRALLYRVEREYETSLALPPEFNSSPRTLSGVEELVELYGHLRKALGLSRLRPACDLIYTEVQYGVTQISYLASSRRVRCVPLAPKPDEVRSVEVLLRNSGVASVEVDALQRSILLRKSKQVDPGLYTACLNGEIVNSDVVAVSIELLNYGSRIITAQELKQTSITEKVVRRTSRRKKKKSRKRRKLKK